MKSRMRWAGHVAHRGGNGAVRVRNGPDRSVVAMKGSLKAL